MAIYCPSETQMYIEHYEAMDAAEVALFAVDFRNRRPDFISNFFGLINWDKVSERFAA